MLQYLIAQISKDICTINYQVSQLRKKYTSLYLFCDVMCVYILNSYADIFEIFTWLILPVVICLSQRLSHACVSISF